MLGNDQLNRLERATYRTVFSDGLADIAVGAFVMAIGYARLTDVDIAPGIVGALAAPTWVALRRLLIEPRAGAVTPHPQRAARLRSRIGWLAIILAVAAAGAVGVFRMAGWGIGEMPMGQILLPLVLGVVVASMGMLFDFPRLVAYGAAVPAAKILGDLIGVPRGVELLAVGAAIAFAGLLLLAAFLRANPRLPEVSDDVA